MPIEIVEYPDSLVDASIQDSQGNDVVWIYALTTDGSTPAPLMPIGDEPDATRQAFWRRKAGMLMLVRSPHPLRDGRRVAWVAWVEVSPTFHRQGVATQLYTRAAQIAARDGLHLASDQTLSDEAKGFWTKQATKGRAAPPTRATEGRFVLHATPPMSLANPRPLRPGITRRGRDPLDRELARELAGFRLDRRKSLRTVREGIPDLSKVRGLELESVNDPRDVFIIAKGVRGDASWRGVDYPWQVSRFFRFKEGLSPTGHENARTIYEALDLVLRVGPVRRLQWTNPPGRHRKRTASA